MLHLPVDCLLLHCGKAWIASCRSFLSYIFSGGANAIFFSLSLTLPINTAFAADTQAVGRYIDVSVKAEHEQLWPLNEVVSPAFGSCPSIACAITSAISLVGYTLYPGQKHVSVLNTLNKPIPTNHLRLNNLTIIEAIHTLIGPAYQILVDPYDRLISFELIQSPVVITTQSTTATHSEAQTIRLKTTKPNYPPDIDGGRR